LKAAQVASERTSTILANAIASYCWHHDWTGVPPHLEVIELKRFFGRPFKVWLQVAIRGQDEDLDSPRQHFKWALPPRVTHGDLPLMFRASPSCRIAEVFRYVGHKLERGGAGWRAGEADFGLTNPSHLQA
jgi:hypothetical protein